jgi:predicted phage terminase large subunit-like protein
VAGQLQQRPAPREGGMFKRHWFRIVDAAPADMEYVRYWDKAASADKGDYTVGVLMGRSPLGMFYVLDVVRGQWSSHQRNVIMRETSTADRERYGHVRVWCEEEGGSGGKESAEFTIQDLAGFPVYCEQPRGSKEVRAEPLAAQAEAGNVVLLKGHWNNAFLAELTTFPAGSHDDQVDAGSGAFRKLCGSRTFDWKAIEAAMTDDVQPLPVPDGMW